MIHGNFTISNLTFTNCGAESADGLPCGALVLITVVDLNLTNVIIENSSGYGLLGVNLLGESFITNSVFRYNRGAQGCAGGNTKILYLSCPNVTTFLTIESSQFLFGRMYYTESHVLADTAGLGLHMNCKNVHVHAKKTLSGCKWRSLRRKFTFLAVLFHCNKV